MPVRDAYHETVKSALVSDGWTITDDPFHLRFGDRDLYIDLGAERLIAAQHDEVRIAVEIKSFLGPSEVADLEQAVGQYVVYNQVLRRTDPDRRLYLAVSEDIRHSVFAEPLGGLLLANQLLNLLVFDSEREVILEWIPQPQ